MFTNCKRNCAFYPERERDSEHWETCERAFRISGLCRNEENKCWVIMANYAGNTQNEQIALWYSSCSAIGKRKPKFSKYEVVKETSSQSCKWACFKNCRNEWVCVKYVEGVPQLCANLYEVDGDDDDDDDDGNVVDVFVIVACKESTNDRKRWMHQEKCKQTIQCVLD